ncbi:thiol reductant ABC exporter subunit CydD [Rhodococcus sp. IEGM 1379]|uniref:thiol reductant ABC exporter subunit CydD n=1 Tax=Rhodococcus sp. IEGM 1379 TaxID=3047086 RepID=UPI0024B6A2D2|nr:thiol reductant ABC exporter subunit CydD [Rhodococcus sp. IEGM 1379]MDI9918994.1 thiol reductant ABC exporter subunit CydD [Rhodococcus sp. IEGM 1379]
MTIEVGDAPAVRERRRGPIDPRLWQHSASARGYLILTVVLSMVNVVMVIVTALMIGRVLAGVITTRTVDISSWATELVVLAGAVGIRVLGTWLQARFAHRASTRVVAEIKNGVLASATAMSPRDLDPRRDEIATVVTRGVDGLAPYLTGYLPALILSVTLTPITLIVIAVQDMTSAVIIFVTLPLIPIFMILIGLLTKGKSEKTLAAMTTLSSQLLDLLAGLPTLRALGRQEGPAERVRELGESHRRTTMSALRVAFLSSMVLELLATLCVALVAVSIGLRLVYGDMSLEPGIVALILAPEVYLPLRMVGTQFHAAEDGMAAADKAFELIEAESAAPAGGSGMVVACGADIAFGALSVNSRGGVAPYQLSGTARPGAITVLTGPNGSGKTTAVQALLGLIEPDSGSVTVDGSDVRNLDDSHWWAQVAWLPQHPVLLPGTIRENLFLSGPIDSKALKKAAAATGFDVVVAELSAGLDSVVGAGGSGLSLGQRQRLALTRVLASDRPVLVVDEPTAHLDEDSEKMVLASLRARAERGDTVIVIGHRPSVLAAADQIIEVRAHEN